MANARTRARIEARILERVAYCFQFELSDPRASFLTVTGVSISPDLQLATIRYSVYGTEGDRSKVAHMLQDATGFVRSRLARVLRTRRIPNLRWEYDDSAERQLELENAIQAAIDRDRSINPGAHASPGDATQPESPPADGEDGEREA